MSPEVKAILTFIFVIIVAITVAGTLISGSISPFFGSIVAIVVIIKVARFIARKRRGY